MTEKITLQVRIEPIEPILFGDNRAARLGEGHAISDQDPSPATLYGAIGGRIANELGATGERNWKPAEEVLGPFVRDLSSLLDKRAELVGYALCDAEGQPWFPKPLHLRVEKDAGVRTALELLRPSDHEEPVLSSLAHGWRPLAASMSEIKEDEEPLFVNEALLGQILAGSVSGSLSDAAQTGEMLYRPERRIGLAMSNTTNTAVSGILFSRPYRRFHREILSGESGWASAGFLAWYNVLSLPRDSAQSWDGLGFLGGDRRRAHFRFQKAESDPLASLREQVIERVGSSLGYCAYLLTPAPVPPEGFSFQGHSPIAGALGRILWISGWTGSAKEQGPRGLLSLIPAGSVLFFRWAPEQTDPSERKRWIEKHWMGSIDPEYSVTGFGRFLLGVWK